MNGRKAGRGLTKAGQGGAERDDHVRVGKHLQSQEWPAWIDTDCLSSLPTNDYEGVTQRQQNRVQAHQRATGTRATPARG